MADQVVDVEQVGPRLLAAYVGRNFSAVPIGTGAHVNDHRAENGQYHGVGRRQPGAPRIHGSGLFAIETSITTDQKCSPQIAMQVGEQDLFQGVALISTAFEFSQESVAHQEAAHDEERVHRYGGVVERQTGKGADGLQRQAYRLCRSSITSDK